MIQTSRRSRLLRVLGQDAKKFLEVLSSNKIVDGGLSYHLLLSARGMYQADFLAFAIEDYYLLEVMPAAFERLLGLLQQYKLRSKVYFEEEQDKYVQYAREPLNASSFKDPRYDQLGYRCIVDGVQASSADAWLEDKYRFCIPEGEIDMQLDKAMPLEYGIDLINGIDYGKGCYPGQEVIARTKNLGVVRKRLYKLVSDLDLVGDEECSLDDDNFSVQICSCYKNLAICLVRQKGDHAFLPQLKAHIKRVGGIAFAGEMTIAPWYS